MSVSLSGAAPVVAQQALSLVSRFRNLFQDRFIGGTTLEISTIAGLILGAIIGSVVGKTLKAQLSNENKKYANYAFWGTMGLTAITLNVIVSKLLNLPFSRPASAAITLATGALAFLVVCLAAD